MERHFRREAERGWADIADPTRHTAHGDRAGGAARRRTGLSRRVFAVLLILFGCMTLIAASAKTTYGESKSTPGRSEATTILTGIYEAEMGYFSTHGEFSDDPAAIGFEPAAPPRYYHWKIEVYDCGEFGSVHYRVWLWGNIDGDDTLDIWEGGDNIEAANISDDTKE
jgi:hypothetical protein